MKIRMLPVMIVIMSVFFGIKVVDFAIGIETSLAVEAAEEPEKDTSAKDETQSADNTQDADENKSAEAAPTEEQSAAPASFNPASREEINILQQLAERRQELERRAKALDEREKILETVENRIVERTQSLKKIEAQIQALLKVHDERELAQLQSLVKTYSSMKPKDAARIFDTLDMDILIGIVENMNEKKVGPILSKMKAQAAKTLTVELATRKKLPRIEG